MKTNSVAKLEQLQRNSWYSRSNIFNHRYTEDVLRIILKYYWEIIEVGRERDPELADVWIDLTSAINSLSAVQKNVVYHYAEGWRSTALNNITGQKNASKIMSSSIQLMVKYLNDK